MTTPLYAVTGATGQLGRLAIAALKAGGHGKDTVALVRDTAKAADLGVATRAFNYDSTPAELATALTGVEKLLLISSSEVGKRATQHANVIAAAKAAGVKQIVYTSLLHADTSPLSLAPEHVATEQALAASGLDYVILRNTWYTENYTGSLAQSVPHGAISSATGDGKLTTASRAELAEAAVIVLTGNGHAGKTYELANDEAFTFAELAAETARQSGKPVAFNALSKDAYAAFLTGIGLPAPVAELLSSSDDHAARGALYDDSKALSRLLGRPTETLAQAVATALA